MKYLVGLGLVLMVLAAGGWYIFGPGSDMSGIYVGENDHQAFLVQVVQANGGELRGFFEEANLGQNGQVEYDNVQMDGMRDGKTFTVTLTPSGLAKIFSQPVSLSGTYSGGSVSLDGQSAEFSANLNLQKEDEKSFQRDVDALNQKAAEIEAQNAEAAARQRQAAEQQAVEQRAAASAQDLESRIENDMNIYSTVPNEVTRRTAELEAIGAKLRDTTDRMQTALEREEALGGTQTNAGAQISTQIAYRNVVEGNSVDATKNHLADVKQNGFPILLQHFEEHDAQCQAIGATSEGRGTFSGPGELLHDCVSIENATPGLKREVTLLLAAYQSLFSAWDHENPIQQQIILRSNH